MKKSKGVMTDQDLEDLRQRNAARAAAAVQMMDVRYACHPNNVMRKDPKRANFEPAAVSPRAVVPLRRKGCEK